MHSYHSSSVEFHVQSRIRMAKTVNPKRFVVLGDSGAGKSTFINCMYNFFYGTTNVDEILCDHPNVKIAIPCAYWLDCVDSIYKHCGSERNIDDQTESQTQQCTTYTIKTNNLSIEIIDTPGFNDKNGTDVDERNLAYIEKALKEATYLTGIIIIANGSVPRLGLSFKNFLHLLHRVWPNDLLNNCVAVLTNCDELSVNLDPSVVRQDLNVDERRTFTLQNSLFRWDRTNRSVKTLNRLRQDFEDNHEKIEKLVNVLVQFNDVSTQSFQIGAIKILSIERCIIRSINSMIDLIQTFKEQQIAQDGIIGARNTMQNNAKWEQCREINVIGWMEVPRHRSPSPPLAQSKFTQCSFSNEGSTADSYKSSSPSTSNPTHLPQSFDNRQEQFDLHSGKQTYSTTKVNLVSYNDERSCKNPTNNAGESYPYTDEKYLTPKSAEAQKSGNLSIQAKSTKTASVSSKSDASRLKVTGAEKDSSHVSKLANNTNQQQGPYKPSKYSNKTSDYYHDSVSSTHAPMYEQRQTKIQVVIPDNEARSHHAYAQQQEYNLRKRATMLKESQQILSNKITSLLQLLREKVAELWSIHRNYDLLERNHELLNKFKEEIKFMDDNVQMKCYFDETVSILSKPPKC